MSGSLPVRLSARGLVVDHLSRILLCEYRSSDNRIYWITPGGRCEEWETLDEALERELREEVGLELLTTPRLVWRQTILDERHFPGFAGVDNFYFLVRVHEFDPRGTWTDAQLRSEHVHGFRWWTRDEIDGYVGPSLFAPRDIAGRLADTLGSDSFGSVIRFDTE